MLKTGSSFTKFKVVSFLSWDNLNYTYFKHESIYTQNLLHTLKWKSRFFKEWHKHKVYWQPNIDAISEPNEYFIT